MSAKKKIALISLVVIVIIVFMLSCFGFELHKTSYREYKAFPLSNELKERISHDVALMDNPNSVIRYSCALTAEILSFSNINDIPNGKANCVGYAQLSSTICNYALKVLCERTKENSYLKIRARPVVGTVHYANINLNNLSQKILPKKYRPFFKDHDFMEVDFGRDVVYIDACLYDLFGSNNL